MSDHWNFAPRGGFTWSPFKSGKTTIRAGGGLFYDWLESETYEQTLRVDGEHQQDMVIVNPGYPDPFSGGPAQEVLPPSRYMLADGLVMPKRAMVLFAVTQRVAPDHERERELQPSRTAGTGSAAATSTRRSTASGRIRRSATSRRSNRPRDSRRIRSASG